MQNVVQLDPQVLKQLQQQFVRPKDEFTGTWSRLNSLHNYKKPMVVDMRNLNLFLLNNVKQI
ncbi:hypothetical protein A6B43_08695 [Vespertiliibacter pulmonis]|nr:hypothetical protein A6B43_08695 [Vespertiliibacter pulmonis]